jgi:hypothetical protein
MVIFAFICICLVTFLMISQKRSFLQSRDSISTSGGQDVESRRDDLMVENMVDHPKPNPVGMAL